MADEEEVPAGPKIKKCLIVVTSCAAFPDETPTGYYLSETVHPYNVFVSNGWEVAFASVTGTAVADPSSVSGADAETTAFWEDPEKKALLDAPKALAEVPLDTATTDYEAIYFAGGFGCMFDFPECAEAQALIKAFVEAEKPVAAVCHGPCVLANVVLGDETKLLADKLATGFSDAEEDKMGKLEVMTNKEAGGKGTCAEMITAAGGKFQLATPFTCNVVKSGLLYTGQNPASAAPLATQIVYYYDPIKAEFEPPRLALLSQRAKLIEEMEAAELNFNAKLGDFKKTEANGGAVADKLEELQTKSMAGRDVRNAWLADLDAKLERNATRRQAALDAKAAAEAAAAEEE